MSRGDRYEPRHDLPARRVDPPEARASRSRPTVPTHRSTLRPGPVREAIVHRDRLYHLRESDVRLLATVGTVGLGLLLLSSCSTTGPGQARTENPFSAIPADLLVRPLPPVPLNSFESTKKTPPGAAQPAGSSTR